MNPAAQQEISFRSGAVLLKGTLSVPPDATATVVFAHGTGSSRFSPRNQYVAKALNHAGLGTFLIDLLTEVEEEQERASGRLRFDIGLLAERLIAATAWLVQHEETRLHRIGYFGASTGAAAALVAAAELPRIVGAVVSRSGRLDLSAAALPLVEAPTLLIVAADDRPVMGLTEIALNQLVCQKKLEVIPHASHSFAEPGALEAAADLALKWFQTHLIWEPGQRAFTAS